MKDFTTMELVFMGFSLIGGLGLFLYGMNIMAEGLQRAAGNKMKDLLSMLTTKTIFGVLVGTVVTAIIQSSSATTVMVVGFVNAGLMNLIQATSVIMGANIGTTITSWIVSSSEWLVFLSPEKLAPLAVGIGVVILMVAKSNKKKEISEIIIGFGILFIGLTMMSDAMKPLRDLPELKLAFQNFGHNPFLGVLAGIIVTAVIQSSSASVGILQVLAAEGLVPWNAAVYIILGQNIGTCITAMLSSIGTKKTAKRAAVIHLLFNIIGTVVVGTACIIFFKFVNQSIGDTLVNKTGISVFHTAFNIINTIILLPFPKMLVALSEKIVRGSDEDEVEEEAITLRHLDERILETPSFAVENAIKEVVHMGELAISNTKLAIEALFEKDLSKVEQVKRREKDIDKLEKLIAEYLIKISNIGVNEHQNSIITNLFHTLNDVERIGDHAENISELAEYYTKSNLNFSETATHEMNEIIDRALSTAEMAIEARRNFSEDLVRRVEQNEELVDTLRDELREKHIRRLASNLCDTTTGVVFLDMITNLERISDHALNIAYFVRDEHRIKRADLT